MPRDDGSAERAINLPPSGRSGGGIRAYPTTVVDSIANLYAGAYLDFVADCNQHFPAQPAIINARRHPTDTHKDRVDAPPDIRATHRHTADGIAANTATANEDTNATANKDAGADGHARAAHSHAPAANGYAPAANGYAGAANGYPSATHGHTANDRADAAT